MCSRMGSVGDCSSWWTFIGRLIRSLFWFSLFLSDFEFPKSGNLLVFSFSALSVVKLNIEISIWTYCLRLLAKTVYWFLETPKELMRNFARILVGFHTTQLSFETWLVFYKGLRLVNTVFWKAYFYYVNFINCAQFLVTRFWHMYKLQGILAEQMGVDPMETLDWWGELHALQ